MYQKFIFIIALLLFVASATAVETINKTPEDRINFERSSSPDVRVMAQTDASENTKHTRCRLGMGGTDNGRVEDSDYSSQATLTCPDGKVEHTDDWVAASLATGDTERAPENIAIVKDKDSCPGDQVCYLMNNGSITVTVVNTPPTVRGNSMGNPMFEGNENDGKMPENEINSATVIGFGSFSISKRSARTGRNPQTGKEIQETPDESDRAIANRVLASVRSADCRKTEGRERCIVEAIEESDMYSDLSAQGNVEILMTLTADPLAAPQSNGGGDCDDTDPGIRPGVCGKTTHFVNPDLDADGLPDLAVEQSGNIFNWTVDGKTVATTSVRKANAADTQVIFMQVESDAGARSRPELIDAIASTSGLSKADSKKALEGFIDTTNNVASEPECCFDYNSETKSPSDTAVAAKDIDKASPKLYDTLTKKDNRIAELEARIRELESENEITPSAEASPEQGNDRVVRKKPGRAAEPSDADSDGDGIIDGSESDESEPVAEETRRPGFVNRLLGSIFG